MKTQSAFRVLLSVKDRSVQIREVKILERAETME